MWIPGGMSLHDEENCLALAKVKSKNNDPTGKELLYVK